MARGTGKRLCDNWYSRRRLDDKNDEGTKDPSYAFAVENRGTHGITSKQRIE